MKICPVGAELFHADRQTDRRTDKQTWRTRVRTSTFVHSVLMCYSCCSRSTPITYLSRP